MIRSMTGFGEASREVGGVHYTVELRSLNNKYFKAVLRLPDSVVGLEAELESQLRKRLTRGTVTLSVSVKDKSAAAAYEVNEAALGRYLERLTALHAKSAEGTTMTVDLAALLTLPGVVQAPENTELVERSRPVLQALLEQAVDRLTAMREREGNGLREDLVNHCRLISERLGTIRSRAPHVVEEYHQRLRARVDELLARAELKIEQVDLIREVAIYAERCDISEELQRLTAHLEQFEQILNRKKDETSGRTLDFIAQELLREANTIASKSNDAEISRTIVEVKGAIDRIKEQVQNVE